MTVVFFIFMQIYTAIWYGHLIRREGKDAADKDLRKSWLHVFMIGRRDRRQPDTRAAVFQAAVFRAAAVGGGFSGGSFGGSFGGGGASGSW